MTIMKETIGRAVGAVVAALILASPVIAVAGADPIADGPVAKVGGRVILLSELNRALGSLPINDPSSRDDPLAKNAYAKELLLEMIDAELLYREAATDGIVKSAEYRRRVDEQKVTLLDGAYRARLFAQKAMVPDERVEKYADQTGLEYEAAKAILVAGKRKDAVKEESLRLFDKYRVVFSPVLAEKSLDELVDADRLVTSSAFSISYGSIRDGFHRFGSRKEDLVDYLADLTERRLFAAEGEAIGLIGDSRFKESMAEFAHSAAVAIKRERLARRFAPNDAEVADYIAKTGYLKQAPRYISALLIVTATKEEAASVRREALAGGSFYELAMARSIAPFAKEKAGRIGVMVVGRAPYTDLDRALLSLKPGEISQPREGEHGWSIFKMLEISPAEPRDPAEARRLAAETIVDERMTAYLMKLRGRGNVTIYTKTPGGA
jgi:parvulin-like peptidyl-prolyl isomerase